MELIRLDSTVELTAAAADGKPARVSILAYSGGMMSVDGFGDVAIELSGLSMPATIPLLGDHTSTLAGVAGSGNPRIDAGRLVVTGTLASNQTAQSIIALSRDGVPLQASVGVAPSDRMRVQAGDSVLVNGKSIVAGSRGLSVIKAGSLREVSILPLGADASTSVAIFAKKGQTMSTDVVDQDVDEIKAERTRVREIRAACGREHHAIEAQAVDEGWTLEATKAACLDALRASRATLHGVQGTNGHTGVNTRDMLTASCLLMGGHGQLVAKSFGNRGEELANSLERLSGYPELAALALRLEGKDIPRDRHAMLKAAFSTTDMPVALGSSVEKVALDVFLELSQSWLSISKIVPASTFREGKVIRLAANSRLQEVAPDGEIKSNTLSEDAFSYRLKTYAKRFMVTRQDVINDDQSLLSDVPVVLGSEAARTVSDLWTDVLISATGSGFFSSGNKNLLSGSLGITEVAAAVSALRTMTDQDGRILGLVPAVLLVPSALEFVGSQVLLSNELSRAATADQAPKGNPLASANIITHVEPRLDADSTTSWFLFSLPRYGAMLVATLMGKLGATVETAPPESDVLGFGWRCFMDVGVSLGEHRAAIKSHA